jgi:hypothetical protein
MFSTHRQCKCFFFVLSLAKIFLLELIFGSRSGKHYDVAMCYLREFYAAEQNAMHRRLSELQLPERQLNEPSIIRAASYANVNYPTRQLSDSKLSERRLSESQKSEPSICRNTAGKKNYHVPPNNWLLY